MRAHFVDGPAHGNTVQLEGEPSDLMYVAALMACSTPYDPDDTLLRRSAMAKHRYRRWARTTKLGTVIYAYEGEE